MTANVDKSVYQSIASPMYGIESLSIFFVAGGSPSDLLAPT